jgi:hypothetical protein
MTPSGMGPLAELTHIPGVAFEYSAFKSALK